MRRMKSRIVRVKVWHEPDATSVQVESELRDVIANGLAAKRFECLHSIDVGQPVAPARPTPDFD